MKTFRIASVLLAAALTMPPLGEQTDKEAAKPEAVAPPAAKDKAIFAAADTVTLQGPSFPGGPVTKELLPPGTTAWIKNAPPVGPPAVAALAPGEGPFDKARAEARVKALEDQQKEILQLLLQLQKTVGSK